MKKPGTISITIYPSVASSEDLSVVDAMQQVLDTFQLLTRIEEATSGQTPINRIIWKLDRASTNSPLTIEASAVSSDPTHSVGIPAQNVLSSLTNGFTDLIHAREKPIWAYLSGEEHVTRIFERNINGIGRMDIAVGNDLPIIIDHKAAFRAINFLRLKRAEELARVEDLTHQEHGALEAEVTGTTTHYRKPAINIRLRLGGKMTRCVLSPVAANKIGPQHNWTEVWTNQRVLITGTIHYDQRGDISLIEAEDIEVLPTKSVSLDELDRSNPIGERDMRVFLNDSWREGNG